MKWPNITDADLGPTLSTFPDLENTGDPLLAAVAADWAEDQGHGKVARYLRRIADRRRRSPRFRWRFPDRVCCWAHPDEPGALVFILWAHRSMPLRWVKYKVFDWDAPGAAPAFSQEAVRNLRKRMVWQLEQRRLAFR